MGEMTDLEFEEKDIWGGIPSGDEAASEAESEAEEGPREDEESRKRGASSSSSSDSELDEHMDQNIKAFRGAGTSTDSVAIDFGHGSLRGRPRSRRESLDGAPPVKSQLGTSLPINIPSMARPRRTSIEEEQGPDKASTFVPPHMIQQADTRMNFSLSSASAAKREKLLQRNAILRRTGFIEAGTAMAAGGNGALPELMDPLNRRMMPIKESHLEASALSAALGSPTGKQQQEQS